MWKSLSGRGALLLGLLILALASLAPTFMPHSLPEGWRRAVAPIRLGLDLQGGMHLVLGVEVEKAVAVRVDGLADQAEALLREKDVTVRRIVREAPDRLLIEVYDRESGERTAALLRESGLPLELTEGGPRGNFIALECRLSAAEVEAVREYAMRQALETLRQRVDQFGVSEPVLQRQSGDRILVQLPGVSDAERAVALLGRTALLEFRMVAENADPQDPLPDGAELLVERRSDPLTGAIRETSLVVAQKAALTGDLLADARVRIDSATNQPYVAIDFNALGAKRFDQLTAANVGRRMAIVLDGSVHSAPVIRERIAGGSAQISGAFSEQEASDLAIVLRSGALPAPIEVLEERTVGPSLGRDSIRQGILSVGIAGGLVVVAMVAVYGMPGLVANAALALNLVFILALLSLFKATLTLPGIAGIVLTIGMAVDANVLIYERIREELAHGRSVRSAVGSGYEKALSSIVDSNLTTLIAALVLFQFGTGPVKGFAVTLSIGIATSMFTALVVTRLIFDYLLERRGVRQLNF